MSIALVGLLALAGCGGGGDEASTTGAIHNGAGTETGQMQGAGATKQGKGTSGKAQKPQQKGSSTSPDTSGTKAPPISSAPVEGSKAAAPGVKTNKGGDNSVQTYGTESSAAARAQAATTVQAYLNARRDGKWAEMCSYLAEGNRRGIERYIENARRSGNAQHKKSVESIHGCPDVMRTLTAKVPPRLLRRGAVIDEVLSFRSGGDLGAEQGFLLFVGPPDRTLYSVPMNLNDGEWKVATFTPIALPV